MPPDVDERTIAVIGGRGQMGQLIAKLFADLGHAVMIADLDTELEPTEAAAVADVVVISVSIELTVGVITTQDRAAMRALFDEVRELCVPFSDQALEQSSYLIDRLVERMD